MSTFYCNYPVSSWKSRCKSSKLTLIILDHYSVSKSTYQQIEESMRFPHTGNSFGNKEHHLSPNLRSSQDDVAFNEYSSRKKCYEDSVQQTPGWKHGISLGSNAYLMDLRKSDEYESRALESNDGKMKNTDELRQLSSQVAEKTNEFSVDLSHPGK